MLYFQNGDVLKKEIKNTIEKFLKPLADPSIPIAAKVFLIVTLTLTSPFLLLGALVSVASVVLLLLIAALILLPGILLLLSTLAFLSFVRTNCFPKQVFFC